MATETIYLRVSPQLKTWLFESAKAQGVTMQSLIIQWLEREQKKKLRKGPKGP